MQLGSAETVRPQPQKPVNDSTASSPSDDHCIEYRQALPSDTPKIHALLRPYVSQHLLLSRTDAEITELTRHGFVACIPAEGTDDLESDSDLPKSTVIGFAAVEVYSPKLAELQSLAVRADYQRSGVGQKLVDLCVQRTGELGVMEIMAISSSEKFLYSCGFDYSLPDQKRALFRQLRPRPYEAD
ncbi:MAG: hypothetical protein CBB71_21865 [Rhodopirellula sp. TMED11]|nr:MAG: hypothetical protein CBB71_21865 [Rhodopirellula sp. TMED11]